MRAWVVGIVFVVGLGCSSSSSPCSQPGAVCEQPLTDAGPSSDSGSIDAGADTASPRDAGSSEASVDGGAKCNAAPTMALLPAGATVSGVNGSPTFQAVTNMVTIPSCSYRSISLQLKLTAGCTGMPPSGQNWPTNCDPYDRLVHFTLADPGKTPLLLLDAATPFGADATWTVDLTDYAQALVGSHTFSLSITTYADPKGQASGTNAQWGADAELTLSPGAPPHDVVDIVPIFMNKIEPTTQALSAQITAPAGATHARLDFYTTGHGAAGAQMQCDEFCQKTNTVTVDGSSVYGAAPWVDCSSDCSPHVPAGSSFSCGGQTFDYYCGNNPQSCPVSPTFPRANWCPAQQVNLIGIALPDAVATGNHTVGLSIANVEGYFWSGVAAVFWR